jgi:chromate transport protein ChrA
MNNLTRAEAGVAVLAAAVAAAVWAAARLAGVDLVVKSGSGTSDVNAVSVVVTALVVAIVAAALLRLLERRTSSGRHTWTIVAIVVWAVSFLGPLSATRPSAGLVLASLHLLVGAVVVLGLRRAHAADRTSPDRTRPDRTRVA